MKRWLTTALLLLVALVDFSHVAASAERSGHSIDAPVQAPEGVYMRGDRTIRLVALTFDDGPDVMYTPQVLDILRKYNVKATFFLLGSRALAHPHIVRRIIAEGHEVGNHTMTHPLLTQSSPERIRRELTEADRVLRKLTGKPLKAFRPPYGAANPEVVTLATKLGYRTILWDIDSLDWLEGSNTQAVLEQVVPNLRTGAIILEHSAGGVGEDLSDTVAALPQIILSLRLKGLQPVTVSELLQTGRPVPGEW